uniref:CSON004695 protein n=1 Tax=Culicoides sonorensis TaxID=179676 RepID=A0A336LXR7_CULSO
MNSIKILGIFVVAMSLLVICKAQLTFTPTWGKRGGNFNNAMNQQNSFNNMQNDACKTPVETLLMIYRLIQAEAQKLIDCGQQEK